MIHAIAWATNTPLDRAIGQVVVGAFFFAMRSCKYSSVSGERRMKLLELRNIRLYKKQQGTLRRFDFSPPGGLCLHYFLLPEE